MTKRVVTRIKAYRKKGMSFRAIEEKMGHAGSHGWWAFAIARANRIK